MLNILSSYPDWPRMRLWGRCGLDGGWWNVRSHWRQESYFIKLFSTSLHTCVIFIHVHFIYMYFYRYRCCRTLFMIKRLFEQECLVLGMFQTVPGLPPVTSSPQRRAPTRVTRTSYLIKRTLLWPAGERENGLFPPNFYVWV